MHGSIMQYHKSLLHIAFRCSLLHRRARLEELEARLGRNLAAVGAVQASAAQAPPTVEKVLRGVAAGKGLAAGAADAAGAEAEQAG